MPSYNVVDLDELEGEGPGGMVRKVRRALGARGSGSTSSRFRPTGKVTSTTTRSRHRRRCLEFVTFGAPIEGKYEPPTWG